MGARGGRGRGPRPRTLTCRDLGEEAVQDVVGALALAGAAEGRLAMLAEAAPGPGGVLAGGGVGGRPPRAQVEEDVALAAARVPQARGARVGVVDGVFRGLCRWNN